MKKYSGTVTFIFLYKILSKAGMFKLLVFSTFHEKKDSVKIETTVPLSSCRVMQEGRNMDNIFSPSRARTIWSPSVHCSLRQVSISQVPRSTCPAAAAAGAAVPAHVQLPAGRALRWLLFPLSPTGITAEQPVTGSTVQHWFFRHVSDVLSPLSPRTFSLLLKRV